MKKNPAIKRHEGLVQFSKDHHFGLLLVWKIRQGLKMHVEPERIGNYAIFFFESDLIDHFQKEEESLFSKLNTGDTLRQQAYREHFTIQNLVSQLRSHKININLLNEFADTLEAHIRFEERVLFNHLQNTLTEQELIRGLEDHNKQACNVDEKWSDHFWLNKQ